tara:strand:+ start:254 stop:418 length:165 start_codon:yes stop_codon:yes gene_type:complete
MRKIKYEDPISNNESLIGGASLSLSDLEIVQSREIKWVRLVNGEETFNEESLAA